MPVKSDQWIKRMAERERMIEPFAVGKRRDGVISYGLSSYGYDLRLAEEFRLIESRESLVIDPKNFDANALKDISKSPVIPPGAYVLTRSLEYFRIPRNVIALCFGKSTYARSGIVVNVTPLEPEWDGYITMSISNTSPFPVRLYPGEGIAQVIFIESDELCKVSYSDKKGKYQGQNEITPPKI